MKKLFILVLVAFSLTACGSNANKVVCTDTDGAVITLASDKEDKVTSMKIEEKTEVSKEEYDNSAESMKLFMDELSKVEGLSMSASHKGDTATMVLEFDFTKMSAEDVSDLGYDTVFGPNFDSKTAIQSFESDGFNCK